jgi:hypothetical protein
MSFVLNDSVFRAELGQRRFRNLLENDSPREIKLTVARIRDVERWFDETIDKRRPPRDERRQERDDC